VPGRASIESAVVETEEVEITSGPGTPHNSHAVFESCLVLPAIAALLIVELTGTVHLDLLFSLGSAFLVAAVLLSRYFLFTRSGGSGKMRMLSVEKGIEALFSSLDYNLLVIFGASFIVSGTLLDTGIPSSVWSKLVGSVPLSSPGGVVSLIAVIVFGSQLLGNVPVMYMVASLLANDKSSNSPQTLRSTWLLVAFTSTMAGNVLLSGSACGVIVAEKSSRHEFNPIRITALEHFAACCAVTLVCISVGGWLLISIDSLLGDIAM
jgi:Na+/H+ antiporter NhaD/arsenite permease-like protein